MGDICIFTSRTVYIARYRLVRNASGMPGRQGGRSAQPGAACRQVRRRFRGQGLTLGLLGSNRETAERRSGGRAFLLLRRLHARQPKDFVGTQSRKDLASFWNEHHREVPWQYVHLNASHQHEKGCIQTCAGRIAGLIVCCTALEAAAPLHLEICFPSVNPTRDVLLAEDRAARPTVPRRTTNDNTAADEVLVFQSPSGAQFEDQVICQQVSGKVPQPRSVSSRPAVGDGGRKRGGGTCMRSNPVRCGRATCHSGNAAPPRTAWGASRNCADTREAHVPWFPRASRMRGCLKAQLRDAANAPADISTRGRSTAVRPRSATPQYPSGKKPRACRVTA